MATGDGLWTVWTAKERACPQPRRRSGPLFDDQMVLFSIVKVQTE